MNEARYAEESTYPEPQYDVAEKAMTQLEERLSMLGKEINILGEEASRLTNRLQPIRKQIGEKLSDGRLGTVGNTATAEPMSETSLRIIELLHQVRQIQSNIRQALAEIEL